MTDIFHWPLSSGEEVCRWVDTQAAVAAARSEERRRLAQLMRSAIFDKNGRLHSYGSSIEAGNGIEFCCHCDGQQEAARRIIALLEGGK